MHQNEDSDFKTKSNSVENSSNKQLGLSESANSTSQRAPYSNSQSGPSNSNSRLFSLNNYQHDRGKNLKISRKRLYSENNEWERNNKLYKKEIPNKVKKERNSENDGSDIPSMNFLQMPARNQHFQPHQAIPLYGYSASQNYHMDPSQGMHALNHYMPSWSGSYPLPPTYRIASTSWMGTSNAMKMVDFANGNINAYPFMNSSDVSLYGMVPIMPGNLNHTSYIASTMFNNFEPITVTRAVLSPRLPGEKPKLRRKPPGCKTVFIGGLPEKITEDILREVFEICGPISTVRFNHKNFCHIVFKNMESVEQAICLAGFRIKIDESEDPSHNGKLHVDYAFSRDDQRDYKCSERAGLCKKSHNLNEAFRPPSPPPVPQFSEYEAEALANKLRSEETLKEGLQLLNTWLVRGECNKQNSSTFFTLIQITYGHVKKLKKKKIQHEEEIEMEKEKLNNVNFTIDHLMKKIEKVFVAAKPQKVWDHFTKNQREIMDRMKDDTINLKETNSKNLLDRRVDEPMELSDDEESGGILLLSPSEEKMNSLSEKLNSAHQKTEKLRSHCPEHQGEKLELKDSKKLGKPSCDSSNSFNKLSVMDKSTQCSLSTVDGTEDDFHLKCLISVFLHSRPLGASVDCIFANVAKIIPTINKKDVESMLRRFPGAFSEICSEIDTTLEKKWLFHGFQNQN